MANLFPAQAKVNPSFSEPDLIVTYAQPSGAWAALAGAQPRVKIGSDDLYVYINGLDLRTDTLTAQSASNFLPSCSLVGSYYSTATYLIRARATWDHHDISAAARYNVALPQAQELAMLQAFAQQGRGMLLYGYNPANNEGLLNAPNAVQETLPPDSYHNTTLETYDNGQLALQFQAWIVALLSGTYQAGMPSELVLIGPQRILVTMQMQKVVQTTSIQRPGAGYMTTAQAIETICKEFGCNVSWHFDDTLIGKGLNGADMVILTMPELSVPDLPNLAMNTGAFNEMQPSMKAVNVMYADMAAPMNIPTPVPDGGITTVKELRMSSAWNLRYQGLYLLSIPYQ